MSLGTGRYESDVRNSVTSTSLKTKLSNVINSATDTEGESVCRLQAHESQFLVAYADAYLGVSVLCLYGRFEKQRGTNLLFPFLLAHFF